MSMRFPYRPVPTLRPVVALGGRWVRPRPILAVTVIGPSDSRLRRGILGTGADDTTFPASLAPILGIDLTNAPAGEAGTASSARVPIRFAQVRLRITDGRERREWLAWVGFTASPLQHDLLGFGGFLQFFSADFRGDREEVELTVNSLYSGI